MRTRLLVASAMVGGILAIGGIAGATPTTIGPHQYFIGLVNGKAADASVAMVCPLPLHLGELGHPLNGTVAVEPPSTVAGRSGDTGSRGRSVVASFVVPVPATTPTSTLTFARYGSQPIPGTLLLPCSGSGSVVFAPGPTSKNARDATVSVSFVNVSVGSSATCATVSFTHFVFIPPSVHAGQSSSATLTAHNCTDLNQAPSVTWVGRFVGSRSGLPSGCPAIDPIAVPAHLAPHKNGKASVSYLVPTSCTATSLQVTATVESNGQVLAQKTATLTIK
jgi:hypothetical protein